MQSRLAMLSSPRCGARTRCGEACCAPAMPNGRCRMHGGRSPGAPKGNQHAFKHGRYGAEAIARRRYIGRLLRNMRVLTATLDGRVGGGSAKSAEQPHAKDEAAARQRPAPNSAEQPHAKDEATARRRAARNSGEQPHAKGAAAARRRPAPNSAKQPHAKGVVAARRRPAPNSAKQPHAKGSTGLAGRAVGKSEASPLRPAAAEQEPRYTVHAKTGPGRRGIVAIGQHCCRKASCGVY